MEETMQANSTKAKLQAGETVFGCFVRYADASLIEMMGYQDWDFLVFDAEHGTLEPRECEHLVRAAELRGVTPLVRATTNSQPVMLRFLDTGAQGVHIPWVNTASEAQSAVRSVKYFPRGQRGLASVRAADYGLGKPLANYVQQANSETLVVLQIETAEAVEQLPEILAVPDIDVIFIGPTDLSNSLGMPGQLQHPTVQKTMQRIIDAVTASPVALGIMVNNMAAARQWQARGARYIATTIESLLVPAMRDYLQKVRE
jgi:4-hydroxy-2-oxoheptanedioate aldolase